MCQEVIIVIKQFEINGYIEATIDVSEKEFFGKFIQFVESNNWSFIGVTKEIINGEYIDPDENKEKQIK